MPFKNPHPLYSVWQSMRRRCLSPGFRQWADYGGRGISICPEWDDFHQFVEDMGPRPSSTHSIDRIDNDGPYSPGNCRWATKKEQQRNQRTTRRVTIEGQEYLVAALAELSGLKHETIVQRAESGMAYDLVVAKTRYPFMGGWKLAVAARVRNQREATHCKHGHQWTAENTSITPQGWKRCKACHRAKMQRLNARKRGSLPEI